MAYASRSLTETEQRWATVEKEALSCTWACERFAQYLVGMKFTIKTDHKSLVPLLQKKRLDELPIRIQRLRIRLFRFWFDVTHVAGNLQQGADALSRAPLHEDNKMVGELEEVLEDFSVGFLRNMPASEARLEKISEKQK